MHYFAALPEPEGGPDATHPSCWGGERDSHLLRFKGLKIDKSLDVLPKNYDQQISKASLLRLGGAWANF